MKIVSGKTTFEISPAETNEQNLCFSQMDTPEDKACIGHLRGDFGSSGEQFHTSWWPHQNSLYESEFGPILDDIINGLRENGLLASRGKMYSQLAGFPQAKIKGQWQPEYAFCIHTEKYRFYLRCNPHPGDYNLYCYAYSEELLRDAQRTAHDLPLMCWSRLKSTNQIVMLKYKETGYWPYDAGDHPGQDVQQIVDALNQKAGISKAQVAAMEAGSMFGWHVPAADPRVYDENGLLKHAADKRRVFHER